MEALAGNAALRLVFLTHGSSGNSVVSADLWPLIPDTRHQFDISETLSGWGFLLAEESSSGVCDFLLPFLPPGAPWRIGHDFRVYIGPQGSAAQGRQSLPILLALDGSLLICPDSDIAWLRSPDADYVPFEWDGDEFQIHNRKDYVRYLKRAECPTPDPISKGSCEKAFSSFAVPAGHGG
jgi:hypothetical protein